MRIRLHVVSGETYTSDSVSIAEVMADQPHMTEAGVIAEFDKIERLLSRLGETTYVHIIVNKKQYNFNPANIVWTQVDRSDD